MRKTLTGLRVSAVVALLAGCWADPGAVAQEKLDLPDKCFRVSFRTLLIVGGSFVQEMTFETAEPAEISIMLVTGNGKGGGAAISTKRRAGKRLATGRMIFLLDYVPKQADLIKRSGLRFAMEELADDGSAKSGAGGDALVEAPDAVRISDILKVKLRGGDYPYTGSGPRDGLEVLSVGQNRLVISVSAIR